MIGIYKITSPAGAIYIGKSRSIKKRWWGYLRLQKKVIGNKIYNSLKKYGPKNHLFEIIEILPKDIDEKSLSVREIFYWQQYVDQGFKMLNSTKPAINPKKRNNFPISQETKDKISQKLKGRKHSAERIKNIDVGVKKNNPHGLKAWNKGITNYISEETRNKIKTARAKQVFSPESNIRRVTAIKNSGGLRILYNGERMPLKRIFMENGIPYKYGHLQYKKYGKSIEYLIEKYKLK